MNIRSRGFVAAMEDDGVEEMESNELPTELQEDAAALDADASEIHDEVTDMEGAVQDADSLNNIAEVAEAAAEEGEGLDPVAAEIAEVAVESIYARLGVTKRATPSMEAFGSTGSRKSATRIAVEDWKDTVKRVWEAVKKFFVNLWEKVKALFDRFLDFFRSTEKAAEAMKRRVQNLKGKAKEKTMENASALKAFGAKGGTTGASVAAVLKEHEEAMADIEEVSKFAASLVTKNLQNMLSGNIDKVELAKDGKIVHKSNLINGGTLKLQVKDGVTEFTHELPKKERTGKVAVLTREEMVSICDDVIRITKKYDDFKKSVATVNDLTKSAIAASDKISGSLAKMKSEENNQSKIAEIARQTSSSASAVVKAITFGGSGSVQAGKAALSYVAASMGEYSEKEEKK